MTFSTDLSKKTSSFIRTSIFMKNTHSMLVSVEHEKSVTTSGPGTEENQPVFGNSQSEERTYKQ